MLTFFLCVFILYHFVYFVECVHSKPNWEHNTAWWSFFLLLACVFLIIAVNNGFVFVQYTVHLPLKEHHD